MSCCLPHRGISQEFVPTFKISKTPTHKIPKGQDYIFGYLEVLENRKTKGSRSIQLPVYIFKSRHPNPKKDPIIYTVGGPGATTMPSAQYMRSYQYLDDRDLILIEQRGNYYAKPHLDCPEWSKAIYDAKLPDFDSAKKDSHFENAATACRKRLISKGIDLNGYNTNEIAADINDLINVLGIETYNLLTISYSTKIAQVLMRDYPEKIRSVVMDSPLPLEVNYDEQSVANLFETLTKVLSDCEKDYKCRTAYPNIKRRFFSYLKEKTVNPLKVQIKHPITNDIETFFLKGEDLITVFTTASTANVPDIPFEINKLLRNDLSSIKENLSYLFEKPGNGSGMGMRLSVWCAEEQPFSSLETIEKETSKYPQVRGLSPAVFEDNICRIWNVKKVSEQENQAIKSDIPVLFISGEYDNETPVKWARSMSANFKNSHHLIFKGWKHTPTTNWTNQCAMQAARNFFNNPVKRPNPECYQLLRTPKFKTQ